MRRIPGIARKIRTPRRPVARTALALAVTLVATGIVAMGSLAAWQVYTENDGSQVAAGTLRHTNVPTGGTMCTSSTSLPMSTSCQLIISANQVAPGSGPFDGNVTITNVGSLQSTFTLQPVAAGTDPFCADLTLTVTDLNTPAITYVGGLPLSSSFTANLETQAATPSLTWNTNDANTFLFAVALTNQNNSADQGRTCAVNYLFTQTNT